MSDAIVKDRGWKALMRRLQTQERFVKVGVIQGKGAEERVDDELTMAGLAAIHEFGTADGHVPERAPIRRTFAQKEAELKAQTAKVAKAIVTGKVSPDQGLELLGMWGASEIKKTISQGEGVPPPNAPATVAKKKSDRPLVDTGRMINAYTYEVEE